MNKLFNAVKWGITLGPGSQNFLGAKWIQRVLNRTPDEKKRLRALQILSLSPHYFFCRDEPGFAEMTFAEYLNTAFEANRHSRRRVVDEILSSHLKPDDIVLDYGCGPGFLARALAPRLRKVLAYDISPGALACARILNPADNLEYVGPNEIDESVPDASVDLVVSLALVQHLTDRIYRHVIGNCFRKLKPGGRLLLHVQITETGWHTEQEWRDDTSLRGRLKMKYGLHCFSRTEDEHIAIVESGGFEDVAIASIAEMVSDEFDDVCRQHLVTARKPH